MRTEDPGKPHVGSQAPRGSRVRTGRWGMGVSTAREKSPTPKLLTALTTTPRPSNSSTSTCRTSSPSPRIRDNEAANSAVASSGFFARKNTGASPTRVATPSQGPSTPPADTSWDQFDEPSASCGPGGRDPRRRKSRFKIIIVYRGDWCQPSLGLLRGESPCNSGCNFFHYFSLCLRS